MLKLTTILSVFIMSSCSTVDLREFEHLMTEAEKDRFFGEILVYGDTGNINLGEDTIKIAYEDEFSCLKQTNFTI